MSPVKLAPVVPPGQTGGRGTAPGPLDSGSHGSQPSHPSTQTPEEAPSMFTTEIVVGSASVRA